MRTIENQTRYSIVFRQTFTPFREYHTGSTMDSLQGQLLIAAPRLADPNFFHTCILMVQHNDEGALGLVLNRPLGATVAEVWTQVSDATCCIEGVVHQGGPCEGPLMVLHGDDAVGDMTVMPGVSLTTNKGVIETLVEEGSSAARFFVGYAGWAAGQLEQEIDDASWLLVPAQPDHIFEETDNLWQQLHKQAMRTSHVSCIPPEIMPEDPSLN